MSELQPTPITLNSPVDSHWALVRRIADSAYFRKGPKLRAFFLYVCENTLLGRIENVREQLIGCQVFGRVVNYNLGEDNIVRVEARELRKRLVAYFSNEGRDEPIVIEIPKGTYVPVFKAREPASPLAPDVNEELAPLAEDVPPSAPAAVARADDLEAPAAIPKAPASASFTRWLILALAVSSLISTAALVWLWQNHLRWQGSDAQALPADYAFYNELLGPMGITPGREAVLVLSNPRLVPVVFEQNPPRLQALTVQTPLPKSTSFTGMGEAVTAYHLFSSSIVLFALRRAVFSTGTMPKSWI